VPRSGSLSDNWSPLDWLPRSVLPLSVIFFNDCMLARFAPEKGGSCFCRSILHFGELFFILVQAAVPASKDDKSIQQRIGQSCVVPTIRIHHLGATLQFPLENKFMFAVSNTFISFNNPFSLKFLLFLFANPLSVFSDSSHFCVARYLIVCTLETYYYTHTHKPILFFGAFIFLFHKRIIPSKKAMLIRNGRCWDQIHIRNTSFIALREMTWY